MFTFLKDERGSQTIEFVATIPFYIIMMLMIWQFGLAAYAMVVAEAAANDGARAAAAGNKGIVAAQKTAYGFKIRTREERSVNEVTFAVSLDVPMVKLPFLDGRNISMTAKATMPLEKNL
jgi:Flp pilus assembly protein TadG